MTKSIVLSFLLILFAQFAQAQTCCSGGVPLSTNLGFATAQKNTLHLAFSTDLNRLNSLFSENEKLELNNRSRQTESFFFRVGYDITEKWSLEALFPFIIQRRSIEQNSGLTDAQRSFGLGDIVLLLRRKIISSPFTLELSAGLKFPSGSTTETNDNGLLLVNDLQPGSGSLDGIFLISSSIPLLGSKEWYTTINYQPKGVDDDYLGSLEYGFGDELQIRSGVSDQWLLGNQIFSPSFGLRYRVRARDMINNFSQENTGGKWLMGQFGWTWNPEQQSSISAILDLPFYTNVDGTQLSNSYILNVSFYKKFNL